jgi:hypothetical protein
MLHRAGAAPASSARTAAPAPARRGTVAARGWLGLGGGAAKPAPATAAAAALADQPSALPSSTDAAIRQAQLAAERALRDGRRLLEIDFPPVSITSVAGDGDGQREMNDNLRHLRRFLGAPTFRDRAARVRVLFGDPSEAAVAVSGSTLDPAAGRARTDPAFPRNVAGEPPFQIGYLTRPNALWSLTGVNFDGWSASAQVAPSDEVLVVAYPTFNAKEELGSAREVYEAKVEIGSSSTTGGPGAAGSGSGGETASSSSSSSSSSSPPGRAMIVFNGELEKLREGYYPPFFYRDLAKIATEWLPRMEVAYSVRNFRGSRPAALVRSYPGLWTLYRRDPMAEEGGDDEAGAASAVAVWASARRPSLKEVALELLPASDAAYREALGRRR